MDGKDAAGDEDMNDMDAGDDEEMEDEEEWSQDQESVAAAVNGDKPATEILHLPIRPASEQKPAEDISSPVENTSS